MDCYKDCLTTGWECDCLVKSDAFGGHPYVRPTTSLQDVVETYKGNTDVADQIRKNLTRLSDLYEFVGICGDGNCAFRAMLYLILRFRGKSVMDRWLTALKISSDNFYVRALEWVIQNPQISAHDITVGANSDILVMGLRFIVAHHIQSDRAYFRNFINPDKYCKKVLTMGKETKHTSIQIVANVLRCAFVIVNADNNPNLLVTPAEGNPEFSGELLFRPGHYDVLIPKCQVVQNFADFQKGDSKNTKIQFVWKSGVGDEVPRHLQELMGVEIKNVSSVEFTAERGNVLIVINWEIPDHPAYYMQLSFSTSVIGFDEQGSIKQTKEFAVSLSLDLTEAIKRGALADSYSSWNESKNMVWLVFYPKDAEVTPWSNDLEYMVGLFSRFSKLQLLK